MLGDDTETEPPERLVDAYQKLDRDELLLIAAQRQLDVESLSLETNEELAAELARDDTRTVPETFEPGIVAPPAPSRYR